MRRTAEGALRNGFDVVAIAEGVGAGSEAARARGLRNIERAGARVVSIEEFQTLLDEDEQGGAS